MLIREDPGGRRANKGVVRLLSRQTPSISRKGGRRGENRELDFRGRGLHQGTVGRDRTSHRSGRVLSSCGRSRLAREKHSIGGEIGFARTSKEGKKKRISESSFPLSAGRPREEKGLFTWNGFRPCKEDKRLPISEKKLRLTSRSAQGGLAKTRLVKVEKGGPTWDLRLPF